MRRLARYALALTLAACGGSSDAAGGAQPTATALRDRLIRAGVDCAGYEERVGDDKPILVREEASCEHGEEILVLDTFNTNSARDSAVQIAREFGGIMVVGDRWAVMADSNATAEEVQRVLGGRIV